MASYQVIIPKSPKRICRILHQIIYQNPVNERDFNATLPTMLFGEVIETCHQIEEIQNELEKARDKKVKLYQLRDQALNELRSTLRGALKKSDIDYQRVPRSIKGLKEYTASFLENNDRDNIEGYTKVEQAFEEFLEKVDETEKAKQEYNTIQKRLRSKCKDDAVLLLRRVRDAVKVNFYHLGFDKYLSQVKAHGYRVREI